MSYVFRLDSRSGQPVHGQDRDRSTSAFRPERFKQGSHAAANYT